MARKQKTVDEKENQIFASKLRGIMDKRDVNQAQIAEAIGKSRQVISQYMHGQSEPTFDTLCKIADYFDVSIDYLLGRTNDPLRHPSAIDELGLSEEAVTGIRYCNNSGRIHGLNMLLGNYRFSRLIGEIGDFTNAVSHNLGVSMVYQNLTSTEDEAKVDNYKFRQSMDEEVRAKALTKLLEEQFPDLSGRISILIGSYAVESQKRSIVDSFDEILRHISKYDELRSSVFRFGDLWKND